MLGRPVPKGLSIHFTDPFKPSSLGQWPSRGAPTAGCWPEARTTPSPSPGAGQAGCPHAPQWLGSTFMCTSSAERLLTQQLRELGRPVQPAGCGWAVPKLGSSARNQGPAQMCVCVCGGGHDSGGPSWASQGTGSLLACSCQANQFLVPKPAWWLWGQQITGATVVAPALGKPLRPTPGRPHPQQTRPRQPVHSRTVVTPHTGPPAPGPSCS